MAAIDPAPFLGIPIELLRTHAGFDPADATHDAEITAAYDMSLEIIESYLDRKLASSSQTETFTHKVGRALSLIRYPLQEVESVVGDNGAAIPFHAEVSTGLLKLDGYFVHHEIIVNYAGGYVVAPAGIKLALLATFDNVWASISSSSSISGTGEIKSIAVPDVGTISYFDSNQKSSSSFVDYGPLPSTVIGMISGYRREFA